MWGNSRHIASMCPLWFVRLLRGTLTDCYFSSRWSNRSEVTWLWEVCRVTRSDHKSSSPALSPAEPLKCPRCPRCRLLPVSVHWGHLNSQVSGSFDLKVGPRVKAVRYTRRVKSQTKRISKSGVNFTCKSSQLSSRLPPRPRYLKVHD